MKQVATLIGAIIAAVAASACCVLPVVLGVASAGTLGFGAALTPYRPLFIGLTLVLLAAAFYFTYRPLKAACDAEGRCIPARAPGARRFNKAMLWGVTALTAA
ncbi:MAG TPA: mercuric transporter MerT family protein, partial [Chloroflexota bacterium]|nr:mercuric transporter MerT family protein [Chloroflexota bacterium]